MKGFRVLGYLGNSLSAISSISIMRVQGLGFGAFKDFSSCELRSLEH